MKLFAELVLYSFEQFLSFFTRMGVQAEQEQLRESMSRSWGAAGASPNGSRSGHHLMSSWWASLTKKHSAHCHSIAVGVSYFALVNKAAVDKVGVRSA